MSQEKGMGVIGKKDEEVTIVLGVSYESPGQQKSLNNVSLSQMTELWLPTKHIPGDFPGKFFSGKRMSPFCLACGPQFGRL